ncbi:glutathione-independent formaldehyde dehydrogenase [Actinopolymorpha sp. NPDC004070]|uniref:glutathione-independent formaldehyde dehydrogenase n=1 Tax=Actinopolymorpha sp. NPDC004070 TaxID=3154548 RepID=UPI0033A5398E
MKAVVYHGPRNVAVDEVPDPRIEQPTDAIVKITSTNICGSDLHMYEGRTSFEQGRIFGHENLGEVVETGPAVQDLHQGDMVAVPFNVACGTCENCNAGLTNYCLTANPDPQIAGAAYGFADMGPWNGGQAEYLRVPWADFNALPLPPGARDKEDDYVMLADIWPTGYHATEMAGVAPGDTVVVYGGGPVGLFAAYSSVLKSASKVMVVDRHPDRLALAEKIGAVPIDDSKTDPVHAVLEQTDGKGADRGCECVGYQAHDPQGKEQNSLTLNRLIDSVKFTGGIGVVGVFVPSDPGSPDDLGKQGKAPIDYGKFWFKGQYMGTGQCPVKRYNRKLCNLIAANNAQPSFLVSHELPLSKAPEAYQHFDARDHGWTKVVLKPHAQTTS